MSHHDNVVWLAGLLEGEGCFTVHRDRRSSGRRPRVRVELNMTDEDVVRQAAQIFDPPSNVRRQAASRSPRHTDTWTATWSGYRAEYVMRRVLPYMGERRSAKINELLAMENLSHHPRAKKEEAA